MAAAAVMSTESTLNFGSKYFKYLHIKIYMLKVILILYYLYKPGSNTNTNAIRTDFLILEQQLFVASYTVVYAAYQTKLLALQHEYWSKY